MRHPFIKLFHLFNFLQMPNDCRMADLEFFGIFSCSCKRISFHDPFSWLLSTSDGQPLCLLSSRLSFCLQNFLKHSIRWAEGGFLTLLPPRRPQVGVGGSGASRPGPLSLAAASVSPPYAAEWARCAERLVSSVTTGSWFSFCLAPCGPVVHPSPWHQG